MCRTTACASLTFLSRSEADTPGPFEGSVPRAGDSAVTTVCPGVIMGPAGINQVCFLILGTLKTVPKGGQAAQDVGSGLRAEFGREGTENGAWGVVGPGALGEKRTRRNGVGAPPPRWTGSWGDDQEADLEKVPVHPPHTHTPRTTTLPATSSQHPLLWPHPPITHTPWHTSAVPVWDRAWRESWGWSRRESSSGAQPHPSERRHPSGVELGSSCPTPHQYLHA